MTKYFFSYRVPADYAPDAETSGQWQAWFSAIGSCLVDLGHAVTDYGWIGQVGDRGSRTIGYSVVSAEDMDSARAMAQDCPALRVGGGVEFGPVMEASVA